eukprot:CAMPEP_0115755510 /NCGR_PEP_ID=MMETSP0272-20121206/97432_1 /TAXON_ID=71861 /ORGANISM="Scrippsiella trochoidea, Strain CCMP3099" /LENGTH=66 /DNA_ID=CAMNT_0003200969 /DNA_START=262 /DNA_END=462 /DNA_ORIENTATION=-
MLCCAQVSMDNFVTSLASFPARCSADSLSVASWWISSRRPSEVVGGVLELAPQPLELVAAAPLLSL